jgi:hypothetical protein
MDTASLHWFLSDGPEVLGLPGGWGSNLLTVGGLITFIIVGLATSRLWTKSQVNELTTRHSEQLRTTETVWAGSAPRG